MDKIYDIAKPDDSPLPLVFDSPHSGRRYPDDFNHDCDLALLQKAEDNDVDDLFSSVPGYGGTLMTAQFPRTYIDVNRAPDDLDPCLFEGIWPDEINPTPRAHAGIGLIRRLIKPGTPVYSRKLSHAEIRRRIDRYYHPYHNALEELIETCHYNFGQVWHINCHSMPSRTQMPEPAYGVVPMFEQHPDFVLGDRDGTSCGLEFTHALRDFLKGLGYRVAINNPYKGVEIVRRHGIPSTGRHSLQLEINKALYWDEEKCKRLNRYNVLKDNIDKLVEFISAYAASRLVDRAAD